MKRLLLVLALLWPVGAVAVFYSGNDIQELCVDTKPGEPKANVDKYNFCVMYLSGLADAVKTFTDWFAKDFDGALYGSCIPADVGQEQLRQVWLKFASLNPSSLHQSASAEAFIVFETEWPCKR